MEVTTATINDLKVYKADINNLLATKATITDLNAAVAKIGILEAGTATINNLLAGNITSEMTQTIHLTGKNVVIDNGIIKSAMIKDLDVSKINAGTISTDKFKIKSNSGGIEIVGETQQWRDENNKVRMIAGRDSNNQFLFGVFDATGTGTLIDSTGVKEKALANGIIKDRMINNNEITGKKINISTLISEINNNSETIKATKIKLDDSNQTLDIAFKQLKTSIVNENLIKYGGWSSGKLHYRNDWIDANPKYLSCMESINLEPNTTYTLSRYSNDFYVYLYLYNDFMEVQYDYSLLKNDSIQIDSSSYSCAKVMIKKIDDSDMKIPELSRYKFKLEKGKNNTGFSLNAIDPIEITQSLQTQVTTNQGKIEGLIKDTTIVSDGSETTLKDAYMSVKAQVTGVRSLVSSTDSKVSSLGSKVTSQNSMIYQLKGSIEAKAAASDITTINNNITNIKTDIASVKTSVSGVKTSITSLETTTKNLNSTISSHTSKFTSLEQSLTSKSIITTISSGLTSGVGSISTTKFIMNSGGLTIKNGGFSILNSNSVKVFYIDTSGNVSTRGNFYNYDTNNILRASLTNKKLNIYNESGGYIGGLGSNQYSGNSSIKGLTMDLDMAGKYISFAVRKTSSSNSYTTVFSYHRSGSFDTEGLNMGANVNMHGWKINNSGNLVESNYIKAMDWVSNNGAGGTNYIQVAVNRTSNQFLRGITTWDSDARLKKNIESTNKLGLDEVMKFKHRQFDWRSNDIHQDIGYIAQELEKINPNYVLKVMQPNGEYSYQIKPEMIIPILSKAIQELKEENDTLKENINKLCMGA